MVIINYFLSRMLPMKTENSLTLSIEKTRIVCNTHYLIIESKGMHPNAFFFGSVI